MKKIKNKGLMGLIIALLFGGGYIANDTFGAYTASNSANSLAQATSSAQTVGTSAHRILATSSLRFAARIDLNTTEGQIVYLTCDGGETLPTVGTGIVLASTTPYIIGFDNLWQGACYAIAVGVTSIHTTEYNR